MADFLKKLPDGASGTTVAQEAVGITDYNRVVGVLNGTDGPVGAAFFASNPAPTPWGNGRYNVQSVLNPNGPAKGDAQVVSDGVMNGTTAVLTSASNPFKATDIGKLCVVPGAGAAGVSLSSTIASFQGIGQVTLAAVSATAVASAIVTWGTDDYASINAAITAAQLVYGAVEIPGVVVGYMHSQAFTVSQPITIKGDGARELFGSIVGGNNPINIPTIAPFLTGSVLIPAALNSDGLTITNVGLPVDLRDFGIRFAGLYKSTGHGINCSPGADGGNFLSGVESPRFDSVKVYGHDGNHYGFRLVNMLYGTFSHLRSYGGGGIQCRGDSSRNTYGNCVFEHPYIQVIVGGTAHALSIEATPGLDNNLLVFIRPQGFVFAPSPALAGAPPVPTSAQACCSLSTNAQRIGFINPDWESNVSAPALLTTNGLYTIGAFGGNIGGVTTALGSIPQSPNDSALALFGLSNQSSDIMQIWSSTSSGHLTFKAFSSLFGGGGIYLVRSSQSVTLGGGTINIDQTQGELVLAALNASTTLTISGALVGQEITIRFKHDNSANAYVITWPATVKRAGGAFANTNAANALDEITLAYDGSNWNEKARALNLS